MTIREILLYEVTAQEIAELPKGTEVLVLDTLYRRNEIKYAGKNKFPAVPRFVYMLFEEPKADGVKQ